MLTSPLDTSLYRFLHWWFPSVVRGLFDFQVSGVENLPRSGPVVLASNHLSNLDPFFLGAACPRQIHWMAKSELWKSRLLGQAIEWLGGFPVRRGQADRESIRAALRILDAGAVLGIFPEGRRQPSGHLGQPAPGVGLFSSRPGVVTIPVAITGTNEIRSGSRLHFGKVTVSFGRPVDTEVAGAGRAERNSIVSYRIMEALAALLAQEWRPKEEAG